MCCDGEFASNEDQALKSMRSEALRRKCLACSKPGSLAALHNHFRGYAKPFVADDSRNSSEVAL